MKYGKTRHRPNQASRNAEQGSLWASYTWVEDTPAAASQCDNSKPKGQAPTMQTRRPWRDWLVAEAKRAVVGYFKRSPPKSVRKCENVRDLCSRHSFSHALLAFFRNVCTYFWWHVAKFWEKILKFLQSHELLYVVTTNQLMFLRKWLYTELNVNEVKILKQYSVRKM